jgi:hypothetical protein
MELEYPFKKDRRGLWYIDYKDVLIQKLDVKQERDKKEPIKAKKPAKFYSIEGIDNYIIKECVGKPRFLYSYSYLKLLKRLTARQEYIKEVEFPVAYSRNYGNYNGLVIPYYNPATSLTEIFNSEEPLKELLKYYHKDSDEINNFICLLLEILERITDMRYQGIYYLDIHPGNFMIYNNSVKVIDFDPDCIYFYNPKLSQEQVLFYYELFVSGLIRRCGYDDIYFGHKIDFYDADSSVRKLRKRLER